jgi:hypothetical protein
MERMCSQCNLVLSEVLIDCISCRTVYCCDNPDQSLGQMCIVLHGLVPLASGDSVDLARTAFQCHKCFDHSQADVYPVRLS